MSNPAPSEGDLVTFTLTANTNNDGTNCLDAHGLVVRESLSNGLAFLSVQTSQSRLGDSYDPATGTWTIGDLPIGDSDTLTIQAIVDHGTFGAGPLTASATARATGLLVPASDATSSITFSVTNGTTLQLNSASLPYGAVNTSYGAQLQLVTGKTGAGGPYNFSLTSGSLPPGLTLSPSGFIIGTPTESSNVLAAAQSMGTTQTGSTDPRYFQFTVTAQDRIGTKSSQAYTMYIADLGYLLGSPIPNTDFSKLIGVNNDPSDPTNKDSSDFDSTASTFQVLSDQTPIGDLNGQLPAGVSISASGMLSGNLTSGDSRSL